MTQSIDSQLAAARTRLILDTPFLGALVLRLPLQAADPSWCPTTATDAKAFYYNPEYIQRLTPSETQFVLAHEALHCALSHFARRGHRLIHRWDIACDFAINPLLVDEGLCPPPNALLLEGFRDMTAEEIYPLLDDKDDERQTQDRHLYDQQPKSGKQDHQASKPRTEATDEAGGNQAQKQPTGQQQSGQEPEPLDELEKARLEQQWRQRLAGAAQQARQAGKLGPAMARLVEQALKPQLPWRVLLASHLNSRARDDFSYQRPSRREGQAILPSARSSQLELVVALDTSGSLQDEEIGHFLAEVQAIKGQLRARVQLLACDNKITEHWVYEPWEEFRVPPRVKGGGGTDFRPVFDFLHRQSPHPELLLYFTDACGRFPAHPPPWPVLWLVKGKEKTPWGQRIQLN
jgi:predicted metal-dependent peptidase